MGDCRAGEWEGTRGDDFILYPRLPAPSFRSRRPATFFALVRSRCSLCSSPQRNALNRKRKPESSDRARDQRPGQGPATVLPCPKTIASSFREQRSTTCEHPSRSSNDRHEQVDQLLPIHDT